MSQALDQVKTEARRLLSEGLVDVFVGYKAADIPMHPQPAFISKADEADALVYDGFCANNLATYLPQLTRSTKIGMVVRGCEARAVNILALENQHPRENLFLVGVPCTGVLDWRKLTARFGENVSAAVDEGDTLQVTVDGKTQQLPRAEALHASCQRCQHPNPTWADLMIGEPLPEGDPERVWAQADEQIGKTKAERYAWFAHEAERCIRCYACREACPMCYCAECFVDHITPRWTESTTSPAGQHAWHITRAFHQTGRCVDCGACERACPMDIKMTYLTDKLNQDMQVKYGFVAGMDIETQAPFATFSLDDKDRFVE